MKTYQRRIQELNSREFDLVDRLDAMYVGREADAQIAALQAECDALRADARHRFADALAESLRDVLSPYARSGDFDDAATTIAAYDAAIDNERSKA